MLDARRQDALSREGWELEGDGESGNGTGRMIVGLVTAGAVIGLGYLVMKNLPEMRRYLRIRSM